MKLINPSFLNAAGNHTQPQPLADGIYLQFGTNYPYIEAVTGEDVTVTSIYNGEKKVESYNELFNSLLVIQADANTTVYISGGMTAMVASVGTISVLAKNTALSDLSLAYCSQLATLELRENAELDRINCCTCPQLTSLDLSTCLALTTLNFSNCSQLTSLDLSANTELTILDCYQCQQLTSLDLRTNTKLSSLMCHSCPQLTSLDLSANIELGTLYCNNCPQLTSLNLSANAELTELYCDNCPQLAEIKYRAIESDPSDAIADAITAATATDGVVYLNSEDEYYDTVADAATAKGWTVQSIEA